MHTNGRRRLGAGDYVVLGMLLFNAVGTAAMYFVILVLGRHSGTLDFARTQAYAWADVPFTVIPQLVAAWGLVRRKTWVPVVLVGVSAVYLHGITVMLAEDISSGRVGSMTYMDAYFYLFAIGAIAYAVTALRQQRKQPEASAVFQASEASAG